MAGEVLWPEGFYVGQDGPDFFIGLCANESRHVAEIIEGVYLIGHSAAADSQFWNANDPAEGQIVSSYPLFGSLDLRHRECTTGFLGDELNLVPDFRCLSIYDSGVQENYLYFLTEGVVAQVIDTENGKSLETALKGNEGVIGIAAILGGTSLTFHTIVLSTSYAYRVKANLLMNNPKHEALLHLLRRYIMALTVQIGQVAVCNRHHSIEARLCSFILSLLDRVPSNRLTITQDEMSILMGVRREGITEAASKLQWQG